MFCRFSALEMGNPSGQISHYAVEIRRLRLLALLYVLACNVAEVTANENESCLNGAGVCVPEHLCENGIIKLFGEGLIDERVDIGVEEQCSKGYICCREDSYGPPLQVDVNLVETDGDNYCEGMCVPFAECPEVDNESAGGINLRFHDGRCPSNQICCKNPTVGCEDGICMPVGQCAEVNTDIDLRFSDQICPFNQVCCKNSQQMKMQNFACKGKCVSLLHCMTMSPESSLINLRISDDCPPSLVCCESAEQPKCAGTCIAREFCADEVSPADEINLRFMDDDCPANQICCMKKKSILKVPEGCDGKCVAVQSCPELVHSSSIDLRLSSAVCPANQVCCKKPFDVEACDGVCIPTDDCADTNKSLINLRAFDDKCPFNTECCKHPKANRHMFLSAPSAIDSEMGCTCVPFEQCLDFAGQSNMINLRVVSNCPNSQICCKNPQKIVCEGICTSYDQCQTADYEINLRLADQSCPKNQICCLDAKTTQAMKPSQTNICNGICVSARQCSTYSDGSIDLRFKTEGCRFGQVCCNQPVASESCNGTCVPDSECLDFAAFNLRLSGSDARCPDREVCCERVKSKSSPEVSNSVCNGRCVQPEQCFQNDTGGIAMINLRFNSNGCPFNQICCQSSLPSDGCDGVCTSVDECDDAELHVVNLRGSDAHCSNNQVCCKKLKASTSTKCKGHCVPREQCRNGISGSNAINLRQSSSDCPENQICCEPHESVGSCNGVCVTQQQCADDLSEINLRNTVIGGCPVNQICCTTPKIFKNSSTCDGMCVLKQYCSDLVENRNEINLKLNDGRCPQNQICCSKPQFSIPSTDELVPISPSKPMLWRPEVNSQAASDSCTFSDDPRTSILSKSDVPWLVSIWSRQKLLGIERNQYECVGSLLQPNLILTSADCLTSFNADQVYARIGDFNLKPLNTLSKRREYALEKITIHPDYNAQSGYANVAVMKLSKNATTKSNICLSGQYSEWTSSADCFLIGWNKQSLTEDNFVNAVPEKHLLTLKAGQPDCPSGLFCTDRLQSETNCDNFQGSPLVCFAKGGRSWKLFGISTEKSARCDRSAIPNILTALGGYEMWIREQISPSFTQLPVAPMPNRFYLPARA